MADALTERASAAHVAKTTAATKKIEAGGTRCIEGFGCRESRRRRALSAVRANTGHNDARRKKKELESGAASREHQQPIFGP